MDRAKAAGWGVKMHGAVIAAAIAPIAIALAGCADLTAATHLAPLGVDPSSPVAADVERYERSTGPVPTFASIPPKPTDVRAASAYKGEVVDLVGDRRTLTRWEAANPPGVADTENYASTQRDRLAREAAPTAAQQADSDTFARKLRDAAGAPSGAKAPAKPKAKGKTPDAATAPN